MSDRFDFPAELMILLEEELSSFGIRPSKNKTIYTLLVDFLTIQRKLIKPIPRKVLLSSIVSKKLASLTQRDSIVEIVERLEKGLNVNQFQSEKLFQTKGHDQLQYEWNIHHFHLSQKDYKGGLKKRTPLLLFVYITNQVAIVLDLDKHGDRVFGNERWLEIIHDDFPQELEKYVHDEIVLPMGQNFGTKERKMAWDKGLTLGMTRIRDKVYVSPGIGRSTSGHSALVIQGTHEIYRWVQTAQDQFEKCGSQISEFHGINSTQFHPRLVLLEGHLTIIDPTSGTRFLKYPELYTITEIQTWEHIH